MSDNLNIQAARKKKDFANIDSICNDPLSTAVEPVQVAPHVYYAGNEWVGVYWVSTKEGIILFDCGMPAQKEIIFNGMKKMGFDPKDIKLILISHGHYDHCGGLKAIADYTKATVYASAKDTPAIMTKIGLLAFDYPYESRKPDKYYEDNNFITLGEFKIEAVVTGGHTEGCTNFFFEDSDEDFTYSIGIHGGLGFVRFNDENFTDASEAIATRKTYRTAQKMIINRKVDIPLSFHTYNLDTLNKVSNPEGYKKLVEPDAWFKMIEKRLQMFDEFEKTSIYH